MILVPSRNLPCRGHRSNGCLGDQEAQELQEGIWQGLSQEMGYIPPYPLDCLIG